MQIKKEDLRSALEVVKPGLATKELIEQSTSFAFLGGTVATFNDEISIIHPIEGMDIVGACKAEELYKFLSKVKGDTIEITATDTELRVTAGRSKAGLLFQKEIKLPLDEVGDIKGWENLPESFLRHLQFCVSSCAKEMMQPLLTGVHIDLSNSMMEASDGNRISQCALNGFVKMKAFILPALSSQEVIKFEPTEIALSRRWVHFKRKETVLSCRIFEDEYPSTKGFFDVKGVDLVFPKALKEALDEASIFSKRPNLLDEFVEIVIKDNRLNVSSRSDFGWFERAINMKTDEELSFLITPHLLLSILSESYQCTLDKKRILFKGDDWQYLAMLRV